MRVVARVRGDVSRRLSARLRRYRTPARRAVEWADEAADEVLLQSSWQARDEFVPKEFSAPLRTLHFATSAVALACRRLAGVWADALLVVLPSGTLRKHVVTGCNVAVSLIALWAVKQLLSAFLVACAVASAAVVSTFLPQTSIAEDRPLYSLKDGGGEELPPNRRDLLDVQRSIKPQDQSNRHRR